ncbi:MAG: hypothetical protein MUF81_06680 [Verrucomicrobia bacterium]|jgi:hypothetical protein|nr:hypothetical protein [Verrucomicrobiota bacterium]
MKTKPLPTIPTPHQTSYAARLRVEAFRFTELAKQYALTALKHKDDGDGLNPKTWKKYEQMAKEHLIRAETFGAAAALVDENPH